MDIEVINATDVEVIPNNSKASDQSFKDFMNKIDPISKSNIPTISYTLPNTDLSAVQVGQESIDSVLELHKEFNQKYGLDLQFETEDVAKMFKSIIDPNRMKIMELYLSESFSRFRIIIYQKLMWGIMQLVQDITSPAYLSENLETKAVLLEKLQLYMKNVEEMYKEIHNPHTEDELTRLAESKSNSLSGGYDFTSPQVQEVIQRLNNTILNESNNTSSSN